MKKRKIVVVITLLVLAFALKTALNNYSSLDSMSNLTTYHNIVSLTGRDFLKQNSGLEQTNFALWKEEKNLSATDPTSGRGFNVALISYIGNSRGILPMSATLASSDYSGCLIDKKTAVALFGNANAKGGRIELGGEEYEIRDVFSDPSATVIIAADQDTPLNMLTAVNAGDKSLDFPCELPVDLAVYKNFAKILACASVIIVSVYTTRFLFKYGKQKKNLPVQKALTEMLLWAVILATILLSLHILPKEILPSNWSDFSYWQSLTANFKAFAVSYFLLGKTRQVVFVMNFVLGIMLAFLAFVAGTCVINKQVTKMLRACLKNIDVLNI